MLLSVITSAKVSYREPTKTLLGLHVGTANSQSQLLRAPGMNQYWINQM